MAAHSLHILAGLTEADMVWLLAHGKLRSVSAGGALVRLGQRVDDLYFVIEGAFAVVLGDGRTIARIGAGEVIGEMSFLERRPGSAEVIAQERGSALAVPRDSIEREFRSDPDLAARFYRALALTLSERLRHTNAAIGAEPPADEDALVRQTAGDRLRRLSRLLKAGG